MNSRERDSGIGGLASSYSVVAIEDSIEPYNLSTILIRKWVERRKRWGEKKWSTKCTKTGDKSEMYDASGTDATD